MEINVEKLRSDLMDYFGTAAFSVSPVAIMDVIDVQKATPQKLVDIAKKVGLNLRNYIEEDLER